MCGITAYVGPREAQDVLLSGLTRLEYRGYDSAGIAVLNPDAKLHVARAVGQLGALKQQVKANPLAGTTGIGHTRWATHGRPTEVNAHPHTSADGRVSLVHNGIIENYEILREKFCKGIKFKGETDTEVAANVIAYFLAKQPASKRNLHAALTSAVKHFKGAYALVAMSPDTPAELAVAREGSPMILGVGDGEVLVASDVPAVLAYTNRVIYLDEGETASLRVLDGSASIDLFNADGERQKPRTKKVELSLEQAEKGGYPHFMLKEINEQPDALSATLRGRIKGGSIDLSELGWGEARLRKFKRIVMLACGTSYYSAVVARYSLLELCSLPVEVEIASEFRYASPNIDKNTLVIAISQSGETTDTKMAAELAKKLGATVLAVCNVMGSSIPRMADATLYTRAGIEIGVASTKAYTTQILALQLFATWFARSRDELSASAEKKLVKELKQIPELAKQTLNGKLVGIKRCADRYRDVYNFMFIGRRFNYATAFEGALKLKEISYIHAEGYGAGEMKHGPLALVEGSFPTVVICPDSPYYDKTISNIQEIKSRDGVIVAIASEGDTDIKKLADYLIYIPKTREMLSPILAVIPLQLLAYYTAVNRGCDPDKPRNLAKAVTVE